jgi:DNA-damage-inducible protein D
MNDGSNTPHTSPFDAIRRTDEQGNEYWSARELYKLLGYSTWQKFQHAIEQAKKACQESGQAISDHFNLEVKVITAGKGAKHEREDYHLSRYACYLIVLAGDESKPVVALGKVYFAVQTRRQELADEMALSTLPEDQKRLVYRSEMAVLNTRLAEVAQRAGVILPFDFAIFQDHGYMGLYGGLKAQDIHKRKALGPKEEILDWMGSDELAANAFRASLTRQKLEREQIKEKEEAHRAHHEMGREVRETIKRTGATLPEDLPTPARSIQQVQREEQRRIEHKQHPSLFDTPADDQL